MYVKKENKRKHHVQGALVTAVFSRLMAEGVKDLTKRLVFLGGATYGTSVLRALK